MKIALIDKNDFLKGRWDTFNQFLKDKFSYFGFKPKRRSRCVYEGKYKSIWIQEDEDNKYYEEGPALGGISDGYHTFDELYDHRDLLFVNLCLKAKHLQQEELKGAEFLYASGPLKIKDVTWWRHDPDGKEAHYPGYFLLFLQQAEGAQISYHIQDKFLPLIKGKIPNGGPEWDKHTSKDVLVRMEEMAK